MNPRDKQAELEVLRRLQLQGDVASRQNLSGRLNQVGLPQDISPRVQDLLADTVAAESTSPTTQMAQSQVSPEEAQAAIDAMLGRNQPQASPLPADQQGPALDEGAPLPPAPTPSPLPVPGQEGNLPGMLRQENKHKLIEELMKQGR